MGSCWSKYIPLIFKKMSSFQNLINIFQDSGVLVKNALISSSSEVSRQLDIQWTVFNLFPHSQFLPVAEENVNGR